MKRISILTNVVGSYKKGQIWGEELIALGMQKGIREYGYEAIISAHKAPIFSNINIVMNGPITTVPKSARNFIYYMSFKYPKLTLLYEKILIPSNKVKNTYFLPYGARDELKFIDKERINTICYIANRIVSHKFKRKEVYKTLENLDKAGSLSLYGAGWNTPEPFKQGNYTHQYNFKKSYKGKVNPLTESLAIYSGHPFSLAWRTSWQIKLNMLGSRIMDCLSCGSLAIVEKSFDYDFPGLIKADNYEEMVRQIRTKIKNLSALKEERYEISRYMKKHWNYNIIMEKMIKDLNL